MGDIVDLASKVLSAAEQQMELIAQNVSNASTPGFKSQSIRFDAFEIGAAAQERLSGDARIKSPQLPLSGMEQSDFSQGTLKPTGRMLDLAISGPGFFSVRSGETVFLTRSGQFRLDEAGRMLTPEGDVLIDATGADLLIKSPDFQILDDGKVLEDGLPVARIALVEPEPGAPDINALSGSRFSASGRDWRQSESSRVHQGMIEAANVSMPEEMIQMMDAVRRAETGAKLVQTYDTLIGQAITTFGKRG
jgi:flagellar basal-body rod protein FlgF